MRPEDHKALAERFITALEAGDVEAVRAIYAPDAKLWHNNDEVEQTVDQNLRVLAWLIRALPERRYRIVRREILADGFMQQHVLEGVLADGEPFAMPACVVVQARDGQIVRLDEYLDPAAGASLGAQAKRAKAAAP
ncbi:nuclear transport factor 2 family protein [Phenylobacterium sp.]|uniref:nuclear transport factor 2 family protein n=1 Tax=Phenylobacterium sp. TaxID=1871053 RepID=UPI0027315EFC|nr:nuclear transport factor 2 family protein [Phenylobacterium sp.]MDP1872590.1 nuclear transport factor 2 family protein [Phenylobacterium sp.]MDP3299200.1 nuclear transport factor 2 family protein [Phenylobacterium sp.]MDP3488607.1 nuclear transport factor 2 family protein [Phenylobacterium sp.]